MAGRIAENADFAAVLLAEERVRSIRWSHPNLSSLSETARLIYASLVDACSEQARQTLAGVDVVWRNRREYRRAASTSRERRTTLDAICSAVNELIASGLLLLLDEETISSGWVRKPWESLPS